MRKLMVYMVLLVHINTFMLFPALPGVHIVDTAGTGQADPINTAFEYIDQMLLGNHDKTPETETTKHHRFVHSGKIRSLVLYQFVISCDPPPMPVAINKLSYIVRHDNIGPSLSYDIVVPPPKAA